MKGNTCDLTSTYDCSRWGFWREVITSSLLQSVTWCVFCDCYHICFFLWTHHELELQADLILLPKILQILQMEGSWQPCIKQVYWHHFSNSICSLHVSSSHFDNFHDISNLFNIVIFVMISNLLNIVIIIIISVISDLWYYYLKTSYNWLKAYVNRC